MYVTRYTLTHIKGTRKEDLFSGGWGKSVSRDSNYGVFLDTNTKCFGLVVD